MSNVPPPIGARGQNPSAPFHPLRWNDPEEARAWLADLHEQILDAIAAGEDAVRPLRCRVLSRAEAGRKLVAAKEAITSLLASAEAGIPREA